MRGLLERILFDRQVLLTFAIILAITIVQALLLRAGVELPDVPLLVESLVRVSVAYALAALVWWVVDRWQGKQKR